MGEMGAESVCFLPFSGVGLFFEKKREAGSAPLRSPVAPMKHGREAVLQRVRDTAGPRRRPLCCAEHADRARGAVQSAGGAEACPKPRQRGCDSVCRGSGRQGRLRGARRPFPRSGIPDAHFVCRAGRLGEMGGAEPVCFPPFSGVGLFLRKNGRRGARPCVPLPHPWNRAGKPFCGGCGIPRGPGAGPYAARSMQTGHGSGAECRKGGGLPGGPAKRAR